jgi:predicted dehydrogenase
MSKRKKILVVGTGSIGKRHIGNLLSLGQEVHAYSERIASGVAHSLPANVLEVKSLQAIEKEGFDAIVIANRTDQHASTALAALPFCKKLFIEKPLSHNLQHITKLEQLCKEQQVILETGFMLRQHPNLQWIKSFLQAGGLGEIMHISASIGQWLPDWRPGTDHRQGFGAFYRYGGGVIMELIHEIDLVQWLLGPAIDVSAMHRSLPALEIETEAIAEISLRLKSGLLAQIHLDYVRPGYGRSLEIIGRQGILNWDYSGACVSMTRADGKVQTLHKAPASFERNTMFMQHMGHFLKRIEDPSLPAQSTLQDGVAALRVALAAHMSARDRRFVMPEEVTEQYSLLGNQPL